MQTVKDLLAIERRLKKGNDSKMERATYARCCQVLESAIREAATFCGNLEEAGNACREGKVAAVGVGSDSYFEAIAERLDETPDMRLGATIHPPDLAKSFLAEVSPMVGAKRGDQNKLSEAMQVFQKAVACQAGIVAVQSPWRKSSGALQERQPCHSNITSPPVVSLGDIEIDDGKPEYLQMTTLLRQQLLKARTGALSVNFSNVAHRVATEVLHQHVFTNKDLADASYKVGVVYADGSGAAPFPIQCLTANADLVTQAEQHKSPLKIGLISMRHLAIDREVTYYWFRNKEVSRTRRLSETDAQCYEETREHLAAARADSQIGDLVIHLYHTGLGPAVLGFYRALVEAIPTWRAKRKLLAVTPMFFAGPKGYVGGKTWC